MLHLTRQIGSRHRKLEKKKRGRFRILLDAEADTALPAAEEGGSDGGTRVVVVRVKRVGRGGAARGNHAFHESAERAAVADLPAAVYGGCGVDDME